MASFPAGGSSIAFVQAPDDIKVELVEAPNQSIPIALHHVHFFNPANSEMVGTQGKAVDHIGFQHPGAS